MRRLLLVLSVVVLALAVQEARAQNNNIKDYNAAVEAIKSKSPIDRTAGLSFLAFLGLDGKGASKEVVGLLFDSNEDVRKWAVLALPKVNPDIAAPVLTLAQSRDPERRLDAMQEISKLGNAAAPAVPALLVFLKQAPEGDRAKVVNVLVGVGSKDPTLAGDLANLLASDPDPKVRAAALAGLQKVDNPKSALDVFGTMLGNADPAVRATAIRSLAGMANRSPPAVQMIRGMLNDASPTVRAAAKQALDQLPKK